MLKNFFLEKYLSFCHSLFVIHCVSSVYMYLTEVFIQGKSIIICHTSLYVSNSTNHLIINMIGKKTALSQVPDDRSKKT